MTKIAILGSTGHIARGLIDNLAGKYDLELYARSKAKPLGVFPYDKHDVVINCIGVKEKLWENPYEVFRITERFDNMCLDYLDKHPETLYVNFSSGAASGLLRSDALMEGTLAAAFGIHAYAIAKINSEAKHRSLMDRNIVDIRVFSYVSEYLPPDSRCLMNEILACIRERRVLSVAPYDFYRDYIHPKDLAQLVIKAIEIHCLNHVFDAYSRRPVSKRDLLEWFSDQYGLQYQEDKNWQETSPTGAKQHYYSNNLAAQEIGYRPEYEALDAVKEAAGKLL